MVQNPNAVVTRPALDQADRCYEAALAAQEALREEYAKHAFDRSQPRIAELHQAINYGLKAAEVSALIGIGRALERLA